MTRPLRLLLVEDEENDAELLLQDLERGGLRVEWERVETGEGLSAALDRQEWDALLSDFRLPRFSGPEALALCKARGLDLPFIIVSGTVSEADAVDSMKAGAHDFVGKNNLARLRPALARELREAESRKARRQAEQALHQTEAQYRQLVESVHAIVWRADCRTFRFTFVSPEAEAILGHPASQWSEPGFWEAHLHPDDREEAVASWRRAVQRENGQHAEYRMLRADGAAVWLRDVVSVVPGPRAPRELIGVMVDVSERRELEAQLLHSQKMEAIGQLAGGVAHDFNNLLGVIIGYGNLALAQPTLDARTRGRLEQIRAAADRAVGLTRQLLAFSRKQLLQPRVLDLNTVVTSLEEMLRRLIGEHIHLVALRVRDLWPARADPGQIEQVIINLAVNARDAMPAGGTLTLETANVELDESYARAHVGARPGPHVMLAVTDTGTGMDEKTRRHLFEPFFTTKKTGEGTGLGLATVYGIVKQSGGHIGVESEQGKGTSFKVYLPRVAASDHDPSPPPPTEGAPGTGSETVLVVEDEPALRRLVHEVLEGAGYRVIEAASPTEALAASASHRGSIDMLVTDLVLPQMGGDALASRVRLGRRLIAVLYMSGYPDQALGHHGVIDPGTPFLQKPFTPDALLRKVREVLDGPKPAASS